MGYFEEAPVADFNLDGVGVVAFDGEEVKAVYGVLGLVHTLACGTRERINGRGARKPVYR